MQENGIVRSIKNGRIVGRLSQIESMKKALVTIQDWELPITGEFVDEEKTRPATYGFLYGSNGEREYMREIALDALNT